MVDDLLGFDDPWEHVRLLSDDARNETLLKLLQRRAPGARVLEVGAGGGLFSVVAARLGARRVYAVEPSIRVDFARELVARNKLEGIVQVLEGRIEDLSPEPVDLAFSELLNPDPFYEGILDAMDAAARWVVPGGVLAPRKLRVWMALVRGEESADEVARVRRTLQHLERTHGLDLGLLDDELQDLHPYVAVTAELKPASKPVCLVELDLGTGARCEEVQTLRIPVEGSEPVRGVGIWFEAEVDDGLFMANPPGQPGHWGHQVQGWPLEVVPVDGIVEVDVHIDTDEGVQVCPM